MAEIIAPSGETAHFAMEPRYNEERSEAWGQHSVSSDQNWKTPTSSSKGEDLSFRMNVEK